MIKSIKIFPPIGVARLGNSRDGYFIGPEQPGDVALPAGGFRDAAGAIKRQAARFHLFAFDENGKVVKELRADDAESIVWTVHLANTKAAAEFFHARSETQPKLRNAGFQGDRSQLKLDPGATSVTGSNPDFADLTRSRQTGLAKDMEVNQQFLDQPVRFVLGTVTTDDKGLLLAMGGYGESRSPTGQDLSGGDFANKDGWYDDISDGRVSATVKLRDGSTPPVTDAWVIVGPPKYAPGLQSVVSLYDTLFQSAVDRDLLPSPFVDPGFRPSLATDIMPILIRAANMRWVYSNGKAQFDSAAFHHTFNQMPPAARAAVFARLATPAQTPGNPGTGGGHMPMMWSDLYPMGPGGTLTQIQFKMMAKWKDGNFVPGTLPASDAPLTPEGLTRAALDPCVGAAFYPGIEASWKIRDVFRFAEPFRPDSAKMQPGDISSQMSLPWQSDFLDCAVEAGQSGMELVWWPAQRPIAVLKSGSNTYLPWARVSDNDPAEMTVEAMITDWPKLGFVVQQANGRFEEVQRA